MQGIDYIWLAALFSTPAAILLDTIKEIIL